MGSSSALTWPFATARARSDGFADPRQHRERSLSNIIPIPPPALYRYHRCRQHGSGTTTVSTGTWPAPNPYYDLVVACRHIRELHKPLFIPTIRPGIEVLSRVAFNAWLDYNDMQTDYVFQVASPCYYIQESTGSFVQTV